MIWHAKIEHWQFAKISFINNYNNINDGVDMWNLSVCIILSWSMFIHSSNQLHVSIFHPLVTYNLTSFLHSNLSIRHEYTVCVYSGISRIIIDVCVCVYLIRIPASSHDRIDFTIKTILKIFLLHNHMQNYNKFNGIFYKKRKKRH